MKKWPRRLLIALGVLVVLGLLLFEVGRRLLTSHYVTEQVASRLAKIYGGPVQVERVQIGVGGSSLQGLRLDPVGSAAGQEPWLVVQKITTDVSLWDVVRGAVMPRHMTLTGAAITLRFDREGRLLTELPSESGTTIPIPEIHILGSQLTLEQEGRPAMKITGVAGTVQPENGTLVVSGSIKDPAWGDWTLQASWDRPAATGSARLSCPRLHLTQAKVESLPLVSSSIWEDVNHLQGDTRVELQVNCDSPGGKPQLRLTLEPIQTSVHIASIDLDGVLTAGSVIVEGDIVKLHNLIGRTADGEIKTSAILDFRNSKRTTMQFDVTAQHLDLTKLPSEWDLPRAITGHLDGHARLELTLADGQLHTDGQGRAVIKDARLAGNPAEPIELILRPKGKGFHFASPTGQTGANAAALLGTLTPLSPVLGGEGSGVRGASFSPLPCTRGRGVGGEGVFAPAKTAPSPPPLSPEYRGEGGRRKTPRCRDLLLLRPC